MIYFVGAGPGDPELITVKGRALLEKADVVIYTGSLINMELLQFCRPEARLINSASLDLEQIITIMEEAAGRNQLVVRLHTGDPSLYGATGEQMQALEARTIPFAVVPGVSSFLAAAASLPVEFTVPGESQTVIITRREGRTPVPPGESLGDLAEHGSAMVIFLSAGMAEEVQAELLTKYTADTPVAVVEKASWKEERVVRGELQDLARITREAGINKTALIMVGNFLSRRGRSKLYDKEFTHGFR
jgi:precorrin-4/cobalt-precorrin-4 C11-methyltransferase